MSLEEEDMKDELCRILTRIKAIEFGAFKLTSRRVSPYYIDLRIVPSFPDVFRRICTFYLVLIRKKVGPKNFDRIAGIPTAAIPFASIIGYTLRKPLLYIRPSTRLHGRERRVEGLLFPGDRVLLVDDLITSGMSLRKATETVKAEGGLVTDSVVLLDREEGGQENLKKEGVTLHYVMKASEVALKLYEMGAITKDQSRTVLKHVKKDYDPLD